MFDRSAHHPYLHSFPTRRSSDLIEFTISPDGSVSEVKGLDSLFPEQQQAWQQWVARFALAWALPPDGMKSGEKWKSEDRKSTRLNSSHRCISYAVFCLKKKS